MNDNTLDNEGLDVGPEHDFSGGVRGKHAQAYGSGVLVTVHKVDGTSEERIYSMPEGAVILDPDIRPYFPDAKAVNRALRVLVELIPEAPSADKVVH